MRYILSVVFLITTNCATSPTSPESFLKNMGYIAVPLKKNAVGHFEVKVKINKISGTFTLDTGASSSAIDKKGMKKFKITEVGKTVMASGLGTSNRSAQIVKIKFLEIGRFKANNIPIISTDLSHVNQALSASGVGYQDGVLGSDVLSQGEAIIDYSSNILFLKPLLP